VDADRLAVAGGGAAYTAVPDPNREFVSGSNGRIENPAAVTPLISAMPSAWLEGSRFPAVGK
jgi:hypothetical protein